MKKSILKLLLVIFGLNVFTSCYGMPPGEWPEPIPEQEQDPAQVRASYDVQEDADPEEEETNEDNQSE